MKTLAFLISFMLMISSCKSSTEQIGEIKSINEVSNVDFTSGQNILLDVRTPEEFSDGNLPNSVNIDFLSSDFESKIKELDPSKTYYVYCKTGNRSTKAVHKMNQLGYKNIVHLNDGYTNYKNK